MSRKILLQIAILLTLPAFAMAQDPEPVKIHLTLSVDGEDVEYSAKMFVESGGPPMIQPEEIEIDDLGVATVEIYPSPGDQYTFDLMAKSNPQGICRFIDCEQVKMASVIWMLQKLTGVR